MMLQVTCFLDVDLADVLKLPDGDVQGAEGPCPPDAGAAVHHYGRAQGVTSPGGGHGRHQLSLLLPHTLTQCGQYTQSQYHELLPAKTEAY